MENLSTEELFDLTQTSDNRKEIVDIGLQRKDNKIFKALGLRYYDYSKEVLKYRFKGKYKPVVLFELGLFFKRKKDYKKMEYYWCWACDQNNTDAMFSLGEYYRENRKIIKSIEFHQMSLENGGDKRSCIILGYYYRYFKKDFDKMFYYYQMGVENGITLCMSSLGNYFYSIKDYDSMFTYYQMGLDSGDENALRGMAEYYHQFDDEKYEYYLLLLIEKDDTDAMVYLAIHYQSKKDYCSTKKYLYQAIEKGNKRAMNILGNYFRDIGDSDSMLKYYYMAVHKGNVEAMRNLANYFKERDKSEYNKYHLMYLLETKNRNQCI